MTEPRAQIPLDMWSVHDGEFSPQTGRQLASVKDVWGRVVVKDILHEDAILIARAVNKEFERTP